eukprot:6719696-Pyramimonas_sp.AAC.1
MTGPRSVTDSATSAFAPVASLMSPKDIAERIGRRDRRRSWILHSGGPREGCQRNRQETGRLDLGRRR